MTRLFMLDTDSVSYALRGEGRVATRILEHRPSELCVSSITLAELRYGAQRRNSAKLHKAIDVLFANLPVLPLDETCAGQFGVLAADLAARGTPIGDFEVLIAAHAMSVRATLITNNVKHFARVDQLKLENWF